MCASFIQPLWQSSSDSSTLLEWSYTPLAKTFNVLMNARAHTCTDTHTHTHGAMRSNSSMNRGCIKASGHPVSSVSDRENKSRGWSVNQDYFHSDRKETEQRFSCAEEGILMSWSQGLCSLVYFWLKAPAWRLSHDYNIFQVTLLALRVVAGKKNGKRDTEF